MVHIRGLSKTYGGKRVIDNVSVKIEKGKMTSFIGPNGAGKSTLLSMATRLITRDAGKVYIDGQEIGQYKSRDLAKKIAILKQSNHLNVRLTVRDLVNFGRFPYCQGRLTEEDVHYVDETLAYMSLENMQNKFLDELSGGQRQRAFLAMVIAQDTEYIVLDEPLNNLDMRHSVEIMKTLRNLVDQMGKTVMLIIHDINFASVYSDHIVALKEGRMVREGPVQEMISSPVLKDIYDMDIPIENVRQCKICMYFA